MRKIKGTVLLIPLFIALLLGTHYVSDGQDAVARVNYKSFQGYSTHSQPDNNYISLKDAVEQLKKFYKRKEMVCSH